MAIYCHISPDWFLTIIESLTAVSFELLTDIYIKYKLQNKNYRLDDLLTVHHGALMNQHQLDTLSLVFLKRVNASPCFERYSPTFRRLCTVAIWCKWLRRVCVDCVRVAVEPQTARSQHTSYAGNYTKSQLCTASWRWASNVRNM
jgi:hypothetical protein